MTRARSGVRPVSENGGGSGGAPGELTGDEVMSIDYQVHEVDPREDDYAGSESFTIQPGGFVGTEWTHLTFDDDRHCEARISANISQTLVRPGL